MMRRTILLAAALALVVGTAVSAIAVNGDGGNIYTACLSRGGALNQVAIGEEPLRPCRDDQTQVSWSEGVSPAEFAELTQRVSDLEAMSYGWLDLFVDCGAGDTLGAALDEAQDHPGPVNIVISGVCVESVEIWRDDVQISGAQPSDGLQAPDDAFAVVSIGNMASGVRLQDMTITGGSAGIEMTQGT